MCFQPQNIFFQCETAAARFSRPKRENSHFRGVGGLNENVRSILGSLLTQYIVPRWIKPKEILYLKIFNF